MTKICPRIIDYQNAVWSYLSRVFHYKLKASELGLTDDLIYRVTEFYGGRPINREVYMLPAKKEYKRGADIDLYIDYTGSQLYNHFMMQAKIMSHSGTYFDLKKNNLPIPQYKKLIKSASKEKASPLYLLYNGATPNSSTGNSNLGCSIVTANEILKHYQNNNQKPSFNILFQHMNPLSYIFCDGNNKYKINSTKKYSDIYKDYPYIRISAEDTNITTSNEDEIDENAIRLIDENNLAQFRVILKFKEEE